MHPFQLHVVQCVLRHQSRGDELELAGPLISNFLGPSRFLSLPHACNFGSIALLDWIWECSCSSVEGRTAEWSLHNYLRSDPHYNRSAFMMSATVVAERGDLELLDWLFAHFSGCEVSVQAVEASARRGYWHILKYLREHDAGNPSCDHAEERLTHAGNVVCWDTPKVLAHAIEQGYPDDSLWLPGFEPCLRHKNTVLSAIRELLRLNLVEFAESLLPDGKHFLSSEANALLCTGTPQVVERMLDVGYLNQHEKVGATAIFDLVDTERLDLMRRIASVEYSPPLRPKRWVGHWKDAIKRACSRSNVAMVEWLMTHPVGQATCKTLEEENNLSCLLLTAAQRGNIAMMQCLENLGVADKYCDALLIAVGKNDLESVKWLLEHRPQAENIPDYCLLHEAAVHGHLGMIRFLHGLDTVPGVCPARSQSYLDEDGETHAQMSCAPKREARTVSHFKRIGLQECWGDIWSSADPMDVAASNGHLDVVKWLHTNRREGCTTVAMDGAARNGHLETVKWLHDNRSEGCTTEAMDWAAHDGHLGVTQWLHENTGPGCTSNAMALAAGTGNLDVVKWLYTNRSEGCTVTALESALNQSQLRVAVWLISRYPLLTPTRISVSDDVFEVILFLNTYFPSMITRAFVRYQFQGEPNEDYYEQWFEETYSN